MVRLTECLDMTILVVEWDVKPQNKQISFADPVSVRFLFIFQ